MLVNEDIIEQLCIDAGSTRTQKARKYQMMGKVVITKVEYENQNNFEIHARVYGTDEYDTYVEVKNGEVEEISCNCPDYYNTYGVCKISSGFCGIAPSFAKRITSFLSLLNASLSYKLEWNCLFRVLTFQLDRIASFS